MEKISIVSNEKEIIIREGKALPLQEPTPVTVAGVLHAPGAFLSVRKELLNKDNCHLLVDINTGAIVFIMNEKDHYKDFIKGALHPCETIKKFGINEEKFYSDKELAKFIRKNIYYFASPETHAALVKSLMKFEATVTTVIENSNDNRGNVKQLLDKKVSSDIPESFVIKCPIFEGYEPLEFRVLIGAEASSSGVRFFLESPELYKLQEEYKRELIEKEVALFREFGCAIMYL